MKADTRDRRLVPILFLCVFFVMTFNRRSLVTVPPAACHGALNGGETEELVLP